MNRIRFTLNTMSVASMATNFILLLTSFLVATIQHPQKSTKCSKNHYFSFHYNSPPRKMFLCIEHASRTPSIKTLTLNADTFFRSPGRGLTRATVLLKSPTGFLLVQKWCLFGKGLRSCLATTAYITSTLLSHDNVSGGKFEYFVKCYREQRWQTALCEHIVLSEWAHAIECIFG